MRIAFFGDGTLSLRHKVRDGRITARRQQLKRRPDWVYLSRRAQADTPQLQAQIRDPYWRGPADAVCVETRWPVYPPDAGCYQRTGERHVEHIAPVDSYYQQAVLLRDWAEGRFGDKTVLLFQDPDLNSCRAIGVGGLKALYLGAASYLPFTPWMKDVLPEVWRRAAWVVPYDPKLYRLETQRQPGHTYRTYRVDWFTYDPDDALDPKPFDLRGWDLLYGGAEYYRRERFWEFYAEAAAHGWQVAAVGEWSDRRKHGGGKAGSRFEGKGFATKVQQAGVQFPAGHGNVAIEELMKHLPRARAMVQIVTPEYAAIGHYTNKVQEAVTAGVIPFIDAQIAAHDHVLPSPWFRVGRYDDLHEKLTLLLKHPTWADVALDRWRRHMAEVFHPEVICRQVEGIVEKEAAGAR